MYYVRAHCQRARSDYHLPFLIAHRHTNYPHTTDDALLRVALGQCHQDLRRGKCIKHTHTRKNQTRVVRMESNPWRVWAPNSFSATKPARPIKTINRPFRPVLSSNNNKHALTITGVVVHAAPKHKPLSLLHPSTHNPTTTATTGFVHAVPAHAPLLGRPTRRAGTCLWDLRGGCGSVGFGVSLRSHTHTTIRRTPNQTQTHTHQHPPNRPSTTHLVVFLPPSTPHPPPSFIFTTHT